MKLVREHIFEKFVEDSDPIKDMGIGIDPHNEETFPDYVLSRLPDILNTSGIPTDILKDPSKYIKREYIEIINNWLTSNWNDTNFVHHNSNSIKYNIWEILSNKLKKMGFESYLFEKFEEDSDPIHDMGIGIDPHDEKTFPEYVISMLPEILNTEDIPEDILKDEIRYLKEVYIDIIADWVCRSNNLKYNLWGLLKYNLWELLHDKLRKRGFKQ